MRLLIFYGRCPEAPQGPEVEAARTLSARLAQYCSICTIAGHDTAATILYAHQHSAARLPPMPNASSRHISPPMRFTAVKAALAPTSSRC